MICTLLSTAILWVILALVSGKHGETSYSTRFYVSLGVTFVSFVVGLCQPEAVIFVTPVICVFAVQKFCDIGWPRSIVATVLYMGGSIASGLLLQSLMSSLRT